MPLVAPSSGACCDGGLTKWKTVAKSWTLAFLDDNLEKEYTAFRSVKFHKGVADSLLSLVAVLLLLTSAVIISDHEHWDGSSVATNVIMHYGFAAIPLAGAVWARSRHGRSRTKSVTLVTSCALFLSISSYSVLYLYREGIQRVNPLNGASHLEAFDAESEYGACTNETISRLALGVGGFTSAQSIEVARQSGIDRKFFKDSRSGWSSEQFPAEHTCVLVEEEAVVQIAYHSLAPEHMNPLFKELRYSIVCLTVALVWYIVVNFALNNLKLRFVRTIVASCTSVLLLVISCCPSALQYSKIFIYLIVLWISMISTTLTTSYRLEKTHRQLFLHERTIQRLLAEKDKTIQARESEIKLMTDKLRAAHEMIQNVMKEANATIRAFEVRYDDLDFEGSQVIGEGSFGTVYRAKFRKVYDAAVKMMRVSRITRSVLTKFKAELAIMAPLFHPNLVRLYGGCWQEGADKLCIVLEFCHAGSLKDYFRRDPSRRSVPMKEGFPRNLALGIARGLRYLHHDLSEPLIHRDIKPDNVLINQNGMAKIADFGGSTHFNERNAAIQEQAGEEGDALTMTFCGTRLYCAPEIMKRERYNQKCDVFSFSLVLLCLAVNDMDYILKWGRKRKFLTSLYERGKRPPIPNNLTLDENKEHTSKTEVLSNLIQDMWSGDFRQRPSMEVVLARLSSEHSYSSTGMKDIMVMSPTRERRMGRMRARSVSE